jgi:magnesium-transporting ATPase (P-type)
MSTDYDLPLHKTMVKAFFAFVLVYAIIMVVKILGIRSNSWGSEDFLSNGFAFGVDSMLVLFICLPLWFIVIQSLFKLLRLKENEIHEMLQEMGLFMSLLLTLIIINSLLLSWIFVFHSSESYALEETRYFLYSVSGAALFNILISTIACILLFLQLTVKKAA